MKSPRLLLAFWLVATILGTAPALRAQGLLGRVLGFLGISATPSQMKGTREMLESGELWIADVTSERPARLSQGSGYRWPVFLPGDQAVLALQGEAVVRIPIARGTLTPLYEVKGIQKLVGFDKNDSDKVLVLIETPELVVGALSLTSGAVTPIPYDAKADRRLITHLRGQERIYDATKLYLQSSTKPGLTGGSIEWMDVFMKQGDSEPRNVSRCDGVDCGQPSLSGDGTKVVFVKAGH
jgi:hypothetical protein